MPRTLRAAAAQFSIGSDLDENLATTCRMLDEAADTGARLVVLPEFCNHPSVYRDAAHCWEVAVDADGPWIAAVADTARRRGVWVQFNVTLRREPATEERTRPWITNSNVIVSADGEVVAISDKTVLMGAEGEHLTPAARPPTLVESPFGTLGSYACMDGIVPEVPRSVAARGARVLMNSLNSFALDEASVHIPVRAAENRAWVIACCKVGPLLPPEVVERFSAMMGVPADMLSGAGESQIVAPDGTVVAQGPRDGEAVVVADIDLDLGGLARPDGTDPWAVRRPELYVELTGPTPPLDDHPRADELEVATGGTVGHVADLVGSGARLVVLAELAIEPGDLEALRDALAGTDAVVVASWRDGDRHVGVVIAADGVLAEQTQLHAVARHPWATATGAGIVPVDLPWGRLAVVVGDDLIHPEVARLAALASVDVLAIPMEAQEPWDLGLGVVERAAENRIPVVAADRGGASVVADLPPDFTLWATSRERPFDGTINHPDVLRCGDGTGIVRTTIHPARSVHRQISRGTNLVDGRPWQICSALVD